MREGTAGTLPPRTLVQQWVVATGRGKSLARAQIAGCRAWNGVAFSDYAIAIVDDLERPNHSRARFTAACLAGFAVPACIVCRNGGSGRPKIAVHVSVPHTAMAANENGPGDRSPGPSFF